MAFSSVESAIAYLSTDLRRAFMKKLETVDNLRLSCSAIVAWMSRLGCLISWKIASNVRLWISVNTRRGFLTPFLGKFGGQASEVEEDATDIGMDDAMPNGQNISNLSPYVAIIDYPLSHVFWFYQKSLYG